MTEDTPHLSAVPAAAAGARRAEPIVDDVPEEVREAARRAFTERDMQAHVLPLGYDSLLAQHPTDPTRRLTFAGDPGTEVAVAVHLSPSGEQVEVEITSTGCSLVEVHCGGAVFPADDPTRAMVGPAPHGLFSAVLEGDDRRRLRTSWVRV